jgi:hypothetical protein
MQPNINLLTSVLTIRVASYFPYRTCTNTCTVIEGFEVASVDTEDFSFYMICVQPRASRPIKAAKRYATLHLT